MDDLDLIEDGYCFCCKVNVKNFDKHINTKSHKKKKNISPTGLFCLKNNIDINNKEQLEDAFEKLFEDFK